MRHGTPGRRSRNNRSHNGGGGNNGHNQRRGPVQNRNHIFDSNGPDVRIRGTAHQVCEKYLTLAKDAASVGDTILAESYLQHAEHYQRIVNSWNEENAYNNRTSQQQYNEPSSDASVNDLSLPASILSNEFQVKNEEEASESADGQLLENV